VSEMALARTGTRLRSRRSVTLTALGGGPFAAFAIGLAACASQHAAKPADSVSAPSSAPVAAIASASSVPAASVTVGPPVASAAAPEAPPAALPSASSGPAAVEASREGAPHPPGDADAVGEVLALQAKLLLVDTVVGTGREAKEGDHVSVHCVGTLADGSVFESSRARKRPLQFVVGGDKVVVGLAEGVVGMRVGGRRTLTVPPALGYGRRGSGTKVPPAATLVFDVELLSVK